MRHLLLLLIPAGTVCLFFAFKKCRLTTVLFSALTGISGLLAADVLSGLFGMNLPLNAFTVAVSAVGGIPGVILLNLLPALFR